MLRLLGCILVCAGTSFLGWRAAQNRKEKVRLLQDTIDALEKINRELSFRMTPIPQILQTVGLEVGGLAGTFFIRCGKKAEEGERSLADIWKQEGSLLCGKMEEKAADVLMRLGCFLGRCDWQQERESIMAAAEELKRFLQEERVESLRCGRLYRTLGVAAGGMLVILLL